MVRRCSELRCTQYLAATMASKWLSKVCSILLALTFIVSALAKLWSADQFEIYVYSYGFFPLDTAYVLARLCIVTELVTGAMLLIGWRRRLWLTVSLAMLLFFSVFLCYAALIGRQDSCQCFGRLADLPPAASLLKNAVLVMVTLLCMRWDVVAAQAVSRERGDSGRSNRPAQLEEVDGYSGRSNRPAQLEGGDGFSGRSNRLAQRVYRWLVPVLIVAAIATPFIVSVPDSWMFGESHERYNAEALNELEIPNEPVCVVAFVTHGCPYCRMTRQKLETMVARNGLPQEAIVYFEPNEIGVEQFIKITYGARPLVLLVQDGEVTATYHYRNINERQIVKAFKE